ncbi:unnamed protein product [marine sediment metagenome]|uniref:Uncharacterized protein n=1 Tax=marine sediment metagenome TaxID=412755 RepID=X1EAG2_9ZZZZ
MTRTYQLPTGFFLLLTVSKLAENGTLTVTGTGKVKVAGEDDKEDTEDFEFTSDGFKQGSKEFTNVSGITSTGITSGTLKIESVSSTGAELYDEYLIKEDVKARIAEKKSLITVVIPGGAIRANLKMYCLATINILENDIIVSNSTRYIATSVIEVLDYDNVHHKTVGLRPEAISA